MQGSVYSGLQIWGGDVWGGGGMVDRARIWGGGTVPPNLREWIKMTDFLCCGPEKILGLFLAPLPFPLTLRAIQSLKILQSQCSRMRPAQNLGVPIWGGTLGFAGILGGGG